MIKHIVMWKLKESNETLKLEDGNQIKLALENLNGQIDGLIHLEVGIDFLHTDSSYDVVLYSELLNKQALDAYQSHPLHVKVASETVKPKVTSRIVVDYEL
ncbi:MAG TPA: stress responsive protein [Firmicutes bacterium]|nr:stress responsive protein [Bacillota bacterium]